MSVINKHYPEIRKMLSVSTIHITKADSELLSKWSGGEATPILVAKFIYGFFLYVWDEDEDACPIEEQLSGSFRKVLSFARRSECSYIQLDCDGAVYEDLDNHDW